MYTCIINIYLPLLITLFFLMNRGKKGRKGEKQKGGKKGQGAEAAPTSPTEEQGEADFIPPPTEVRQIGCAT